MCTNEALVQVASVDGFLSDPEIELLLNAGRTAQQAIVEIGSYRGRSTLALAWAASVPVYAIDPHETFIAEGGHEFNGGADRAAFMRALLATGMAAKVRLINLPSVQVARGWECALDVLWIDGDHREQAVCADVRAWLPFVIPGGLVLLHDRHDAGVRAALRLIDATGEYDRLADVEYIAQYRRRIA